MYQINQWYPIANANGPHGNDWLRKTGLLALYVGPAGERGPRGTYRPGFDHRWTVWFNGTLLAEGFTDSESAAKSAAVQEGPRIEHRIAELIKALDIRRAILSPTDIVPRTDLTGSA